MNRRGFFKMLAGAALSTAIDLRLVERFVPNVIAWSAEQWPVIDEILFVPDGLLLHIRKVGNEWTISPENHELEQQKHLPAIRDLLNAEVFVYTENEVWAPDVDWAAKDGAS